LLEPALQPGIERQAAGRIARIGQSKETKLIRLIVNKSVEEKILEWQQIRMAHGSAASNSLTLNDFAALMS
jgi:SNF2 family DNA or RNA helicase